MRLILLSALIMCGALNAQTAPKPLKCGKYQHVKYGNTCEPGETCKVNDPIHKHWARSCADNLHTVTEREWQELMARLKWLEESSQQTYILPTIPESKDKSCGGIVIGRQIEGKIPGFNCEVTAIFTQKVQQ